MGVTVAVRIIGIFEGPEPVKKKPGRKKKLLRKKKQNVKVHRPFEGGIMSTYVSEKDTGEIVKMRLLGESMNSTYRMLLGTNDAGDELTVNGVWKIAEANEHAASNSYGVNQR